jgi:hypothetical protein
MTQRVAYSGNHHLSCSERYIGVPVCVIQWTLLGVDPFGSILD